MMTQAPPTSPRVAVLLRELEAGNAVALEAFWQSIQSEGTPLIEPIPEEQDGDARMALVTFLWRPAEEYRNVVIYCSLEPFVHEHLMERISGTDLWYKTYRVARDVRTPYWFCPDDSLVPHYDERDWGARSARWTADPLNPRTVNETPPASELVLPEAPTLAWSAPRPDRATGQVTTHTIQSVAAAPPAPVRFSLRAGRLESWPSFDKHTPSVRTVNRHLRDLLRAKGYEFTYGEFGGGHNYRCWEAVLPDQLMELLSDRSPAR
jgi:hypothetical protein